MVLKTDVNNQMVMKTDANNEHNQNVVKADVNNQLLLTTDTNPNAIVLKEDTHNANNQLLLTTDTNNINTNQVVLKADLHMNNQILITDEAGNQVIVAADNFIWKMLNISETKEEAIMAIDQPQAQDTNAILELPTCETYEETTDNEAHGKYQPYSF